MTYSKEYIYIYIIVDFTFQPMIIEKGPQRDRNKKIQDKNKATSETQNDYKDTQNDYKDAK